MRQFQIPPETKGQNDEEIGCGVVDLGRSDCCVR